MTYSDDDDDFYRDEPLDEDDPSEQAEQAPQDEYPNVFAWVEQWLSPVIRRNVTKYSGNALSWDSRWWLYPEVVGRLIALHGAWEEAYASPKRSAMSSWWIYHLEPHLRVILDPDTGPMAGAKPDHTWSGWEALPLTPAPPEFRASILRDGHKPNA